MYLKTDAEREIWTHAYKAALSGVFTQGYGPRPGVQRAAESAHAAVREYRAFVVDGRQPKAEGVAGSVPADRDEHPTATATDTQLDT